MFRLLRLIVNVIFYIIEVLLLIRFFLVLLHANLANAFATWIFKATAPLIAPFNNIFPTTEVSGFRVDFTTLFVLLIYLIIGQLLLRILYYFETPREGTV